MCVPRRPPRSQFFRVVRLWCVSVFRFFPLCEMYEMGLGGRAWQPPLSSLVRASLSVGPVARRVQIAASFSQIAGRPIGFPMSQGLALPYADASGRRFPKLSQDSPQTRSILPDCTGSHDTSAAQTDFDPSRSHTRKA